MMIFDLSFTERQGQRSFIVCEVPPSAFKQNPQVQRELLMFFSSALVRQGRSIQDGVELYPSPDGDIFMVISPKVNVSVVLKAFEEASRGKDKSFKRKPMAKATYDACAVHANALQMQVRINWGKFFSLLGWKRH